MSSLCFGNNVDEGSVSICHLLSLLNYLEQRTALAFTACYPASKTSAHDRS